VIITKTPVRVSLLGGGTDFPAWSRKHGGLVVGGSISRFSYIMARFLPPFHEYKTRLVYREIETVNDLSEVNHRALKAVIGYMGMGDTGLEVVHVSDLPGRSGTGSSSTFVVAALHALSALKGKLFIPDELATEAIRIEQERLGETVGCQDQTWAAFGGVNTIQFRQDGEISVLPLVIDADHVKELEDHLLLFFTKISRTSSDVASTYAPTIDQKEREQFAMLRLAEQGVDVIYRKDWERLGLLVDQSWRIKAGLSEAVTNHQVNTLYAAARLAGAWGGKLTGAGGGGCLLLVAPPEKHPGIIKSLTSQGAVHVPFRFSFGGSQIIFSDKDNLREYRPA
jgi:D-glycero-alpha-D-manno-heptose-7-phosphate kinase